MKIPSSWKRMSAKASVLALSLSASAISAGCPTRPAPLTCEESQGHRDAYTSGVNQANERMAGDLAEGAADWNSRSASEQSDIGHEEGYAIGYREGYSEGYNSADGYPRGYREGREQGLAQGLSDPETCDTGSTAGYNAGYGNGIPLGQLDGYDAGYETGYDRGFVNGSASCSQFAGSDDAVLLQYETCRQRGYASTYRNGKYQEGYDAAKLSDPEYLEGRTQGLSDGREAGRPVGLSEGHARGLTVGRADGFAEGAQVFYQQCFDTSYPDGYAAGYTAGYYDLDFGVGEYPLAGQQIDQGRGGLGDGYYDGFLDGREATCPAQADSGSFGDPSEQPRRKLQGSWEFSLSLRLTEEARESLRAELEEARKSHLESVMEISNGEWERRNSGLEP